MPQFSEEDINAARRRVQEMRNRASRFTGEEVTPPVSENALHNEAKPEEKKKKNEPVPQPQSKKEEPKQKDNENEINEDNQDKSFLVILVLLLLLSKEKADNNLILALLYLLL